MNVLSNTEFSRLVNHLTASVIVTDPNQPDNPIVYCNSVFEEASGYSQSESLGKNPRFLHNPGTTDAARLTIREAVSRETGCRVVAQNFKKDGNPYWVDLSILPVRDKSSRLVNFIGVMSKLDGTLEKSLHRLTPQETRVFDLMLRGYPVKQMAEELGTSQYTVRNQVSSVLTKFHVKSSSQLISQFLTLLHD